jgi:general secretion pathway protein J
VNVRRRNDREGGFTLLEVLIAMTVLGILTGLLASGLGFGTRVWERERRQLDQWSDLETVQELLRRMLTQAIPLGGMFAAAAGQPGTFIGTENAMEFLGPAPAQSLAGGIYKYNLASRADPGGLRLVLTWKRRTPDGTRVKTRVTNAPPEEAEKLQTGAEVILADKLAEAKFSYFGTTEDGSAPGWRNRWQDPSKAPLLVRVQITFPPGDPRLWPELTVAPRIAGTRGGG